MAADGVSGASGASEVQAQQPAETAAQAPPEVQATEGDYGRDPTQAERSEAPTHGHMENLNLGQNLHQMVDRMLDELAGRLHDVIQGATQAGRGREAAAPGTPGAPVAASPTGATGHADHVEGAEHDHDHGPEQPEAPAAADRSDRATPTPNAAFDGVRAGRTLLKKGSRGESVSELQRAMNANGQNPPLDVDGKFGSKTRAAVKVFQQRHGCKVDGVVGRETIGALDRAGGVAPAEPGASAPSGTSAPSGPTPTSPTTPTAPTAPTAPISGGPTPHGAIPARDLTKAQAKVELEALRAQGLVSYSERGGGRVRLDLPVAGVDFRYKARSTPDTRTYALDPRMAVATARLAQWAKTKGVTEITHRGFAGRSSADRHGQGRALDIAGFSGVDPQTGQQFEHDVYRDWGKAPGGGSGYRLDPNSHHGKFFNEAYHFLTSQFRDSRSPSQIGGRSYVISPDHPNPRLARGHANHFHVEVPPT